jgi:hypothetical protein
MADERKALLYIGNDVGLERLVDEKGRQNARVRRATDMSLAAFYFAKYPELAEPTMRRRVLSLDDVQRAEVPRLRAERRGGGGASGAALREPHECAVGAVGTGR